MCPIVRAPFPTRPHLWHSENGRSRRLQTGRSHQCRIIGSEIQASPKKTDVHEPPNAGGKSLRAKTNHARTARAPECEQLPLGDCCRFGRSRLRLRDFCGPGPDMASGREPIIAPPRPVPATLPSTCRASMSPPSVLVESSESGPCLLWTPESVLFQVASLKRITLRNALDGDDHAPLNKIERSDRIVA